MSNLSKNDYLMIQRRVTWQKAKGELLSILEFYMSENNMEMQEFKTMNDEIKKFIDWMDKESPIA